MKYLSIPLLLALFSCATPSAQNKEASPARPGGRPVVTLIPSKSGLEKPGLWRQNLCLADINGDGYIDIITPPQRKESGPPHVFLGDGNGAWKEWTAAQFPKLPYAYGGVDVGDIDGNGLPDIAMGCHERPMYALLQKSPGIFENVSDGLPAADKFTSRAVKLADVNGDGLLEIIALNEGPTMPGDRAALNIIRQKVLALKDGRWTEIPIFPNDPPPQCFGDSLVVGDFNGDGRKDFASASNSFSRRDILFLNKPDGFWATGIEALPIKSYYLYVDAADFDRDGRLDLVYTIVTFGESEEAKADPATSMVSRILVLYNRGDSFEAKEVATLKTGVTKWQFRGLTVLDADKNGFPDFATVLDDGNLYLYLNQGDGTFVRAETPGWAVSGKAYWIGSANLRGEGPLGLVVAYGFEGGPGRLDAYKIEPKH